MNVLLTNLQSAGGFIIVLSVLILVHEWGHFITAKMCGVKVERFSLGFGPRIVGFTRGDTEYRISALPLGGYVKMTGENPDEQLEGKVKLPKLIVPSFSGNVLHGHSWWDLYCVVIHHGCFLSLT